MYNVLAVDIGGSAFRVAILDEEGRRRAMSEGETLKSGGRDWMLSQILERARDLVKQTGDPIRSCGVSFGGPVDFERQRVRSMHVRGWNDFELSRWVKDNLSVPCRVDNDANAGALGEYSFGAGKGCKSIFYITLSTGIGGGMVIDGKLLRGKDGLAGEVGHIPISETGIRCSCGRRGCFETFCSGTAIAQNGKEWAERRPESASRMLELSGGDPERITAKIVLQTAQEGVSSSSRIVLEFSRWLARGLTTVIRLVNPDKIVLGGGVALAGKVFMKPTLEFLEELESPRLKSSTEIVLAELGSLSPLFGAAALGMELA